MNISQRFSRLKNERAFLISTGEQVAEFYKVENAKLEKLDNLKIKNPEYTDNEGHYPTLSGVYGAVNDGMAQYIQKSFLHEFKQRIKNLFERYDYKKIYLFSPETMTRRLKELFPAETEVVAVNGNFTHSPIDQMLERIDNQNDRVVPTSPEAEKILQHANEFQHQQNRTAPELPT